jgi:hypothetical protein
MIVLAIQDNPQEMVLLRDACSNFTNSPILMDMRIGCQSRFLI